MPNNKLGLSLSRKKGFFGPKIGGKLRIRSRNWLILKKKGLCRPKKQAGAELEKKRFFGPKVVGKIEYKRQKLTNSKEKKGLFGPKKTSWGWA